MRKVEDGKKEKRKKRKKRMLFIVATNVVAKWTARTLTDWNAARSYQYTGIA